jgi:type IV pilus assembly protein PilO
MKLSTPAILFLAMLVGLLACSYFFIFQKANERRAEMTAQIEAKEHTLAELQRSTAGVSDVKTKIAELHQAVTFFESKLPQAREMDKILKEVWQTAEANSLQTRTIQPGRSQRTANYSEQPIELSLSGNFNGFYAFLLQLERLPRLTRVTRMELQRISDHDGEMQAKLTLSIFFEPETTHASLADPS